MNDTAMVASSKAFSAEGFSGGFRPNESLMRIVPEMAPRHQRNQRAASMPRSVTTPVRCVVRTTAPDNLVTRLFCIPIAAQRIAASASCTRG